MKNLLFRYKQYASLLFLLAVVSGMGLIIWFGIVPTERLIHAKADGIQEYYASRENRERQIGQLPDLEHQFETITEREQFLNVLLSQEQIVDFVKTLERLAVENKVHVAIVAKDGNAIQDAKPKTTPAASDGGGAPASEVKQKETPKIMDSLPFNRYLRINVILIGEYGNIASFFHKMETLPYALDVVHFEVRARDADEQGQPKGLPANPGNNPFLIFGQGSPTVTAPTVKDDKIPGSLEATFDTVIYVSQ